MFRWMNLLPPRLAARSPRVPPMCLGTRTSSPHSGRAGCPGQQGLVACSGWHMASWPAGGVLLAAGCCISASPFEEGPCFARWLARQRPEPACLASPAAPCLSRSLTSFALSLLMLFKTNSSYSRWWEARTLWGSGYIYVRSILRLVGGAASRAPRRRSERRSRVPECCLLTRAQCQALCAVAPRAHPGPPQPTPRPGLRPPPAGDLASGARLAAPGGPAVPLDRVPHARPGRLPAAAGALPERRELQRHIGARLLPGWRLAPRGVGEGGDGGTLCLPRLRAGRAGLWGWRHHPPDGLAEPSLPCSTWRACCCPLSWTSSGHG